MLPSSPSIGGRRGRGKFSWRGIWVHVFIYVYIYIYIYTLKILSIFNTHTRGERKMFFKETYSGIYPKEPREVASSNRNWAKFAK